MSRVKLKGSYQAWADHLVDPDYWYGHVLEIDETRTESYLTDYYVLRRIGEGADEDRHLPVKEKEVELISPSSNKEASFSLSQDDI